MAAPTPASGSLSLASQAVHADDGITAHRAVAPAMHVSTTFRYTADPDQLNPNNVKDVSRGPPLPFPSRLLTACFELAARFARLLVRVGAQHGEARGGAERGARRAGCQLRVGPGRFPCDAGAHQPAAHRHQRRLPRLSRRRRPARAPDRAAGAAVNCDDDALAPGDVIHVETPVNPVGEARNLALYAAKALRTGAYLTVDATLAPPPLQDPFALGADVVMHSATKFLTGHSDMLCGVLAVRPGLDGWMDALRRDRAVLGAVAGSFEAWLGLRSLRTLELRVARQSATAAGLVAWLAAQLADGCSDVGALVDRVHHASLQPEAARADGWLRQQMPGGFGAVFALMMRTERAARSLPSRLRLFHHATSLGGVESLVEWRAMSDADVDRRLLRFSVGVETLQDLQADLAQALASLRTLADDGGRET